jgi:phosphoglycolate phosphatase
MRSDGKIIFDFDGVIIDSFAATIGLTRRLDNPTISEDEYRELFCGNIFEVGAKQKTKTFDSAETKAHYYRHYREAISGLPIIPGMGELIRQIADHHPLHIVSSADEVSIKDFLQAQGLHSHFESVLGYETAESKVEKFKMLKLHESPKSHLFITDTLGDLKEAAKVGLPAIAVSWGVHSPDRLGQGNALMIVHTVEELRGALDRWRFA